MHILCVRAIKDIHIHIDDIHIFILFLFTRIGLLFILGGQIIICLHPPNRYILVEPQNLHLIPHSLLFFFLFLML